MPVTKLNLYIFQNESKAGGKGYPIRILVSDMVHEDLIFQSDASMYHHYHSLSFKCSIIKKCIIQDNTFKKYFLNEKCDSYLKIIFAI